MTKALALIASLLAFPAVVPADAVGPDPVHTSRLREGLQAQLATATGFTFLAEDDVEGRGIERRGEAISRVVFNFMPGEHDRRYRFFLNDKGEVADFSSERVD